VLCAAFPVWLCNFLVKLKLRILAQKLLVYYMLMKLTTGFNCINILKQLLCKKIPKAKRETVDFLALLRFGDLHA